MTVGRPTKGRACVDAGFNDLMDMYLNPHSNPEQPDPACALSCLPSQLHQNIPNTVEHVLTACPLMAPFQCAGLHDLSLYTIFSTKEEGQRLGEFLQFSQWLLWPLSPQPDPPWFLLQTTTQLSCPLYFYFEILGLLHITIWTSIPNPLSTHKQSRIRGWD